MDRAKVSIDPLLLVDIDQAGPFGRAALIAARAEIGVGERPPGSNRGPRVDQYLVGIGSSQNFDLLCELRYNGRIDKPCPFCHGKPSPVAQCRGCPWCARFARWCVDSGARAIGRPSPLLSAPSLASALKWQTWAVAQNRWLLNPAPGRVGCMIRPDGSGHALLVARVISNYLVTIEGNEPGGVIVGRRDIAALEGFVDLEELKDEQETQR